ncbi:MAG: BTAD domain-containing putative transcriptional regulator [Candidatus Promineifilaceae bacterium]|nr:BTAD domain-containing putative transcriptional regulator [Candidatus Promineifilaceae bacterium]
MAIPPIGLTLASFGHFRAELTGGAALDLPTLRARALLIYLAVEQALGGAAQRRAALVELMWPGMPPGSGRQNLRQTLYYLRQAVPDFKPPAGPAMPLLLADRREIALNPAYPLTTDLAQFLRLLEGPVANWDRAVELYRGDFLADFSLVDAQPFEEWAGARRAAFHQQILKALDELARRATEAEQYDAAERLARRGLALDSLREPARRGLMKALALAGRRSEALAVYEACAQTLMEEIGAEPSPETRALYQDILGDRLDKKDARSTRPKIARPRHNLPAQPTSFVGRQRDLEALEALLDREDVRLVTLTGPGGIGKTRLSIELAKRLTDAYADGVYFVELAPISRANQVLNAIAGALGVKERGDEPLLDSFTRFLSDKKMLLVVDNFEHVIEGASVLATLLAAAPDLKIITTSRERLRL